MIVHREKKRGTCVQMGSKLISEEHPIKHRIQVRMAVQEKNSSLKLVKRRYFSTHTFTAHAHPRHSSFWC